MRSARFRRLAAVAALSVTLVLAACAFAPGQPAPTPAPPPPAAAAAPAFGTPAPACLREGEPCDAAGSRCCAGLVCGGSRSPLCITQF